MKFIFGDAEMFQQYFQLPMVEIMQAWITVVVEKPLFELGGTPDFFA